ncbi:hypothetical protein [Hydrogenivirga sp. 128-5-R1-1]|uniref:hypothetical protein n=1 Tax=Hydrogenivirga sp. 128-5-R1-1 TaxID=392423 RepID=UPI00015EFCD4|nr:hypothetical protein [Hydrogenivirga sp. 128-5-R1-1]EDP74492.1 hypothetical protein HG1285_01488 [Hydrogenivirga sp. 128-5-R1-1]
MWKVFEELGKWFLNLALIDLATIVFRPLIEGNAEHSRIGIVSALSAVLVGSMFLYASTKLRRSDDGA